MKRTILLSLLMTGVSFAGFEKWTNKDGKTAELDLVKVSESGGEKTGEFKMRNGKTVTLKASDLTEADSKRLDEWKPAAEADAPAVAEESIFDDVLDGNLVALQGKSVKKFTPEAKPEKLYIFYYTASWCGPCQKYTPSLVEFYNKAKKDNKNFELVLITSDSDEGDMEDYAKDKQMPWPMLKMSKAEKFKKEFKHGVKGIPSVITCKLDGTIVSKTESIPELESLVK